VLFLVASGVAEEQGSTDLNQAVLDQLRQVTAALDELSNRLEILEAELAALRKTLDSQSSRRRPGAGPPFDLGGPDAATLQEIVLPEGAGREEIRDYIAAILDASSGQHMFSDRDPQAAMLAKVGRENLDLLLEAMSTYWYALQDYHLQRAVIKLATDEDKGLILEHLAHQPGLVSVVLRKGWEEDARDILLERLAANPDHLPPEWVDAVARLQDPSTYPLLLKYLINGQNRTMTFEAIRNLEGIQLDEAVAQAWKRAGSGRAWDRDSMACVAVGYGHVDALRHIISSLARGSVEDHTARKMHAALLRHVSFVGTLRETAEWFEANKERLVFDPQSREFVTH
jgi:hypothetical protein